MHLFFMIHDANEEGDMHGDLNLVEYNAVPIHMRMPPHDHGSAIMVSRDGITASLMR